MEEDDDWDTSTSKTAVPQPSNSNSTESAQQTLKITDGYKYSYEALTSPANVEDWVEPASYGTSKRISNGLSQNSFRDNNKPFRNERSDNYKRLDKRSSNYSTPPASFATPKPSRFSNRPLPNVNPNDWDAPVNNSSTPVNGLWNDNVSVPITNTVDDWDAPGGTTPQSIINHKSTPIPTFNQSSAKPISSNVIEEDWDAPAGSTSKADLLPPVEIPTYRPSSAASVSMHSMHNEPANMTPSQPTVHEDEENWDEPGTPQNVAPVILPTFRPPSSTATYQGNEEDWDAEPSAGSVDNGFAKNLPPYQPSSTDEPYSSNQRYDSSWQANKHPRSRNFDSNDHFSRDPFSRHSRGNFRNNQYDRGGSRGSRGSRGNRGSRGGRDFNSSRDFSSRDNSRNRGDRDKSYSQSSFNKSNDRQYPPPVSFNNTIVEPEEDWDAPSGFSKAPSEKSAPLPPPIPPPLAAPPIEHEESWD